MLAILQMFIWVFLSFVLLPIIIQQLYLGSPPSQGGPLRKYQLAVPRLDLAGNLMVLFLCFIALVQLAKHFEFIDAGLALRLDQWLEKPFLALFAVYVVMFAVAIFRVRRSGSSA